MPVFVDAESEDETCTLHKFTIAPTITVGSGFWARPELRAFVTYASWNDEYEGRIGGTPFADETRGMIYDVQMETWW
ncbi:porin LamB type [Candidatus Vecturithrix granuli]|uniref:Porin LamB type n=1 Tax=Vecturithrix granuli TaxID=1499967 RepID=A0A081BUH3_VECG1|nr:porin LamB type [Candidatus Vecturithrix granuli]